MRAAAGGEWGSGAAVGAVWVGAVAAATVCAPGELRAADGDRRLCVRPGARCDTAHWPTCYDAGNMAKVRNCGVEAACNAWI
jgi:hypothetical protein